MATPADDPDGENSPEATAGLGKDSDLVACKAVKTEEVDLDSQIVTVALWVIVGADLILLPGAYLVSRLPRRTPRTSRKILKEEKSPCFFNERCYNKNQR